MPPAERSFAARDNFRRRFHKPQLLIRGGELDFCGKTQRPARGPRALGEQEVSRELFRLCAEL